MAGWQFWIDRGGTFTDIVARAPDGSLRTAKLLSENPAQYPDAAIAGIRRSLGIPASELLQTNLIDCVKMGSTVATNALLERKGARTLLLTNHGFRDVLNIGSQARPDLFALDIRRPAPLYSAVEEIGGRVDVDGRCIDELDEEEILALLLSYRAEGFESCAIALLHSWKFPEAENRVASLARRAGFSCVSTSCDASPSIGLTARTHTAVVDAYLSPVLRRYIDQVVDALEGARIYFMQSSGGLADAALVRGKDAILSGPAAGIVGAARTAEAIGISHIIGFDMGGTSTDVALYSGRFEREFETEVAGASARVPTMAIHTVAAGGGSILQFDGVRFRVGPESAGARPGPASYRGGGPLTITDANVILGKIQPNWFPSIFGPLGDQPLDGDVVRTGFAMLAADVSTATGEEWDPRRVAEGFIKVAVENMAQAIKRISLERGHDIREFTLQCFGGAAGQHACLIAQTLGMQRVLVHPFAGVLSAYGMGLADRSVIVRKALEADLTDEHLDRATKMFSEIESESTKILLDREGLAAEVHCERQIELRYQGTDTALTVSFGDPLSMRAEFEAAHERRFGFKTSERGIIIESITVEAVVPGPVATSLEVKKGLASKPAEEVSFWSAGKEHFASVYARESLCLGDTVDGPALICDALATTVIEPGWQATIQQGGMLSMEQATSDTVVSEADESETLSADPILLELFNNRYMAVAEQMGVVLRQTSTSVNIKERLDYSCAVFDLDGNLVANAPHVPVHLGAMGESVRAVIRARAGSLKPGDMVVLNDPYAGGTHLPDVTVVAPVFDADGTRLQFFVGNRAHHTDIGGTTPGSMPPDSSRLEEEGVIIDNFLIVDGETFHEAEFRSLLASAEWPARNPDVNVADIRAQIAANRAGIRELQAMTQHQGWPLVSAYLGHVMAHAEESIRRVVETLSDGQFDYPMDDGGILKVAVRVDKAARGATIDFTGTSAQSSGNFNALPAIVHAVVLYVFRCYVKDNIPLNEGCFRPLTIIIPAGSFLAPDRGSAVVAGNTEISQAICNALLGALDKVASSQGTMNNLLFGNADCQYYETIGGGVGAGPSFNGASAVHSHMTNTRLTDPEILELRYPVRVEKTAIRRLSGGRGRFRGGDGMVRVLRFLKPVTATLMSSRRKIAPFGLHGGDAGKTGRQWIERATGEIEPLAGCDTAEIKADDVMVIETPGGGGFGK